MSSTRSPDGPLINTAETTAGRDAVSETKPGRLGQGPAGDAEGASFAPGEVVAGRYRVARFIARGGMGEVYEAVDRELSGRVALKTIRPDIAENPTALERFRREILLARRITHPNVSRVYDIGRHTGTPAQPGAPAPEVVFLTMELLEGESLSARLSRGRPPRDEALELVEQMAAGLDAAHALAIVHRDFKSANVMLVPAAGPGPAVRAVVTDFGLARSITTEGSLVSLSDAGAGIGTASYMAPEQVEGQPVTPAADVYALGVVLYEMVTGIRPFDGGSAISVAARRLTEAPTPPSTRVPGLDPAWERVILRCLERRPEDRFQRAGEVAAALRAAGADEARTAPVAVPGAAPETVPVVRRSQRLRLAGALALGAAAAAGGAYLGVHRAPAPGPAASGPAVESRRSLAVLGLRNATAEPDAAWLGTALSEALATEMTVDGRLRAILPQEVARARAEYGADAVAQPDAATMARLRKNLGVDLVAFGSYSVVAVPGGRMVRLDVRLLDAGSGVVLATGRGTGTEAQVFEVVSLAATTLRAALGLGRVTAGQALAVQASLPTHPEAARLYAEGLERLRAWDPLAARDLLERAVALEPDHPLPRAALSDAHAALGYGDKAAAAAREAVARAEKLPLEQKMVLEARRHEAAKAWGEAISAYSRLRSLHPDDVDVGIRLANAQTDSGSPREALVTLEALTRLPPPASADPRIDIAQARAHEKLSDWRSQMEAAARAARKGEASGASVLVAHALVIESLARLRSGDFAASFASADRAREIFQEAGDRSGAARALNHMAIVLSQKGDRAAALPLFDRSTRLFREVGDTANLARLLFNTGETEREQGHLDRARKLLAESLAAYRKVGARAQIAHNLNSLGMTHHVAGDLDLAQESYGQALTAFGEVGDRQGTSLALTNLAEVLYLRADLDRALQMLEESAGVSRELGDKAGVAYDLYRLGEVHLARGDLRLARERLEEALRLHEELGDKTSVAQAEVALAALEVEEGHLDAAEKRLRGAEEVLRTEGMDDTAGLAQVGLVDALLAQGRPAEAAEVAARAAAIAARSSDLGLRVTSGVASARVRAASGKPADRAAALAAVDRAASEAARHGAVAHELAARLAGVELAAAAGRPDRAAASALARRAAGKGFALVARRAEAAVAPPSARRGPGSPD